LTDEFFCIKEKKDILINPQSYFHTGPWSKKAKDEGISLAYPVSEFKAQPPFPALYDKIKDVLKRKNITIVTFSGDNDARFLNYACTRYHMPCFNYTFIDVQKIYQDIEGLKDQLSLEKMLALFEVDVEGLVQHKSDDDAHITMLVTEALCKKTGKTLKELVKGSQRAVCLSKTYMPKKKKQKPAQNETVAKATDSKHSTQKPASKKLDTKKSATGKTKKAYKPRQRKTKTKKDN
jgi:DNA polymerase III epsilon subunit-like protein